MVARHCRRTAGRVRVERHRWHLIAAWAGAGVAGLPCFLGDAGPDLMRMGDGTPSFSRGIWLVVHPDLRKMPFVRAVMDVVTALITQHGSFRCLTFSALDEMQNG